MRIKCVNATGLHQESKPESIQESIESIVSEHNWSTGKQSVNVTGQQESIQEAQESIVIEHNWSAGKQSVNVTGQQESIQETTNLEIRENLEKNFHFFQSGKSQGIREKFLKSGKNQGILFGQTFPTFS
ncbi:hypothetical protein DPMN_094464 [Dreissena polymorpha]|uniref:Uncharacterized protein n=1 Tax=Dreissena polymorpha TaxID=45954 RepID=A0A9D4L4T2_DREPO|nr:hypothetical protein DPMN_094464 [Dreissena polymorpha]